MTKIKENFFSTIPRKIISSIVLVLVSITLIIILIVNVTPTPVALLARATIFSGDANATPFGNFNEIKDNVKVTKNLTYGDGVRNKFDIYEPKDKKDISENPTLIWVHGGGFVGGDKNMLNYYATTLSNEGYRILAINYSLAPEERYPTPILELGEFIEYLKNDNNMNIDLNNIVLIGDSAGAQIISQFAIIQTNDNYIESTNFKRVLEPNSIKGMILYCGPYDFRGFESSSSRIIRFIFSQIGWSYLDERNWLESDEVLEASIIDNVDKNFPTSYITDGNTASFQEQGESLVDKLNNKQVKTKSRFFDEKKYGILEHEFQFIMNNQAGKIVYNDTLKFLKELKK